MAQRGIPSDAATAAEGALYDVELHAVDDPTFHVRWHGRHAAALLKAMRHGHLSGPVRQVEWGTYQVLLDGASTRRLLAKVLSDDTWGHEAAELVHHPADGGADPIELGTVVNRLDDGRYYKLVADLY